MSACSLTALSALNIAENEALIYGLDKNKYKNPFVWIASSSLPLQYVPPDLCICTFVLEQSLSVRALQEMLAKSGQNSEGVSDAKHTVQTHTLAHKGRQSGNQDAACS